MLDLPHLHSTYLNISKDNSFKKLNFLSEKVKQNIFYIVWNQLLAEAIIDLTENWTIQVSDNKWNIYEWEVEREIKILEVIPKKLIERFLEFWANRTFSWLVDDHYLDTSDSYFETISREEWIKRSFRLRYKFDTKWKLRLFYTIKRKEEKKEQDNKNENKSIINRNSTKIKTRNFYELEFEISNPDYAFKILEKLNLYIYRRKYKLRDSFSLLNDQSIKWDLDAYLVIPPLLEIELANPDILPWIIAALGLENNEKFIWWARSTIKYYGKEDKLIKYNAEERKNLSIPDGLLKILEKTKETVTNLT